MSFDPVVRELRHACRLLVRTPGTSGLMLVVLGLALAGNITLFSIIDTTVLKPLPLLHVERMVNVYTVHRDAGHGGLSYPDYVDLASALTETGACEEVFGYSGLMATAAVDGQRPEVVFGEIVTANYFNGSGAPLLLGSGLLAVDDRPGQPARVVIGHRYWQRRFAGDPRVVNRTIRLNGLPFTVAGVAAPEFGGLLFSGLAADVWVPIAQLERVRGDIRHERGERWLFVRGRLRADRTVDEARSAAAVTASRLSASYPATNRDRSFRVLRTSDVLVNPEADIAVRPLAASVLILGMLVLAIAGANIASVLMARMTSRRRELAVRVSLGATRGQVTRLLGTEAALLGVCALAVGFFIAGVGLRALQSWQPGLPVPLGWTFSLDLRVASFAVFVTLFTVLLAAVLPAWRVTRVDPLAVIRGFTGAVARRRLGRESLLIPQVAFSLVLLMVAGLFTRSLQQAAAIDPGFSARDTAVMALNLGLSGYDESRAPQFWDALLARVRADAGVRAAALTDRIPMDLYGSQSAAVWTDATAPARSMQLARVGDGYFDALGIPLASGRVFDALDGRTEGGDVAVVSTSAAHDLWPGQIAVGQRLRVGEGGGWRTVVGVVGDVQLLETLGENGSPLVYVPLTEGHTRLLRVAAGAHPGVHDLERRLLAAAQAIDPDVAIFETRQLSQHLDTVMLPFRAAAWVALTAGVFGLLMTVTGVAGSVAQTVVARTRDIGIRIALGGSRAAVIKAVAWPAARSTIFGVCLGWLTSLSAAQALGSFLFGIGPMDPLALTVVPALVAAAVTLAAVAPIRRALGMSPASVLRDE